MAFRFWGSSSRRPQVDAARRGGRNETEKRHYFLSVECLESRDLPSILLHNDLVIPPQSEVLEPFGAPGPSGYTPAQIKHAYGIDQIAFSSGTVVGDGSGTTIAIIDAYDDPNIAGDLQQFDAFFGLPNPPSFKKVNQTGGSTPPNTPPASDPNWAIEISLDVEWAHAIAPKANILLVEANSAMDSDLFAAATFAATQPNVVVVSMSFGSDEFSGETSFDNTFTTPTGHTGVTFVASSGDHGAPASYPAISPNVLAVGGTSLQHLDSAGDYPGTGTNGEIAWTGSGGGVSSQESEPTYQVGVVPTSLDSTNERANPDVAYDADNNTGFPVYDTFDNTTVGQPWESGAVGGTSAAAPQWAALIAIADQGRILGGLQPLDGPTQTLPMIYALPASDFHDIINGSSTGHNGGPNEPAGTGYDLATGIGSPVANNIVAALSGQATGTPVATHFTVSAPANAVAGTSFTVTVTAEDADNNVVPGYTGTVHITSSDGAAVLPADATLTHGVGTFTVTLKTAGNQTVTATDTVKGTITGTSGTIAVSAAAASRFTISAPARIGVGLPFNVTITAFDPYNNVAVGYAGTVHFTSSDSAASLPGNSTLTKGVGTFSVTLNTVGNQTVTATDTVNSALTITSGTIDVVGPPTAMPETVIVGQGLPTTVTLYGSAPESDPVSYKASSNPSHGTLSGLVNRTGSFTYITYTSNATYTGPDSFQLTVTDPTTTLTSTATISIIVYGPPVANPQPAAVVQGPGQSTTVTLTGTAPGSDGLKFTLALLPSHGTLSGFNSSTGQVTYTPTGNYFGPDSFTFTVTDTFTTLTSATATVSVNVTPAPITVAAQFGGNGIWQYNVALGMWRQLTSANSSLLAADSMGDVVGEFPGNGVWEFKPGVGFKQINGIDATVLAMDAKGDIVAEFPHFGVGEYNPGIGWHTLTGANASLFAMDANGDVAGAFPGAGVWEFKPTSGWAQLNGVDATVLAMNARGDIVANLQGFGVAEFPATGGGGILNGTQATALAINAQGIVAAEFPGSGVGEYLPGSGWRNLTGANAAVVRMDVFGDVFAEFAGSGVWEYDPYRGWFQTTAADATVLVTG